MRRFGRPFWRWDYDDVVERHWITGMGNRVAGNSGSGLGYNRWCAIVDRVRQRIQRYDLDSACLSASGFSSSGFDTSGFNSSGFDSTGVNQPRGPAGTGHSAGRG
jgi:hypothetical protein